MRKWEERLVYKKASFEEEIKEVRNLNVETNVWFSEEFCSCKEEVGNFWEWLMGWKIDRCNIYTI